MVEALVGLPVSLRDLAHLVQRRRKDFGILEYRAIERHDPGLTVELLVQPELVRQEIELRLERPALHVLVEVRQVGVHVVRLVERHDAVGTVQELHERGLPRTHVARNCD
jgi:hypothetical protein